MSLLSFCSCGLLPFKNNSENLRPRGQSIEEVEELTFIIEELWKHAEECLVDIIQNKIVTPVNIRLREDFPEINPNSLKDVEFLIGEIDMRLVTHKYYDALALLRGCKEYYSKNTQNMLIKKLLFDKNEIETLKFFFIRFRKAKHIENQVNGPS